MQDEALHSNMVDSHEVTFPMSTVCSSESVSFLSIAAIGFIKSSSFLCGFIALAAFLEDEATSNVKLRLNAFALTFMTILLCL